MTAPPSLEDAIKTITAGYRKERIRGTVSAVLFFGSIGVISFGGIPLLMYLVAVYKIGGVTFPCMVLLLFSVCSFGCLYEKLRELKKTEKWNLHLLELYPNEPYHASAFFKHGFYELALEGYDKQLKKLFEQTQEREEKLNRLFEEYRTLPRFIDGFPRPVPQFSNHNLYDFVMCITGRVQCLAKLGREKEAEEVNAQLEVIRKIQNEGEELTKKYWEQYWERVDYD